MDEFTVEVIEASDGCAVVRVAGEVDAATAPGVREKVLELVAKGSAHLIVDLTDVGFLDSTGLGMLVGSLKRVRVHEGSLMVVTSAEHIRRVFRITGLHNVFPLPTSVLDAVRSDPRWEQVAKGEAGNVEEWCRSHGLS
ncbi:STAS domain-containing protein [Actinomadura adrarensis]|uniref:Anti-sigma factor antagonist n=1 Tax=Actinomadura adrarensis TaxID=1819600 RepID=A0ABW3CRQ2_9ACTN